MSITIPEIISDTSTNSIIVKNFPQVNPVDLDGSRLERLINNIKDEYIRGCYKDISLSGYCGDREFCFCMAYVFSHKDNSLTINFIVSHTDTAPAWIQRTTPENILGNHSPVDRRKRLRSWMQNTYHQDTDKRFIVAIPMNEQDINAVSQAFIRQCAHAIRNCLARDYLASALGSQSTQ